MGRQVQSTKCCLIAVLCLLTQAGWVAQRDPLDSKQIVLNLPLAHLSEIASAMADQARIPVCVEERIPSRRGARPPLFRFVTENTSVISALDKLATMTGTYTWRQWKEPLTVNLIPLSVINDPKWTLNRTCPEFKLENASMKEAVERLSNLVYPNGESKIVCQIAYSEAVPGGTDPKEGFLAKFYRRPVTAIIKQGTARDALNQIAAAIGNAWWSYREVTDEHIAYVAFYPVTPNTLPVPPQGSAIPPE